MYQLIKKLTEAKRNRILKKIDKLKKSLRYEKKTYGAYHDGGGCRYSIAELYFQLNDYKKTSRYLNWFDKNFPDDCKYPYFKLGAAVTKYELGKLKEAKQLTIDLNEDNTYLIDLIIGNKVEDQDKYEWTESESLEWAKENLNDHLSLLTENYVTWLGEFRKDELYVSWYTKLIEIQRLLLGLEVSKERNKLLKAKRKCLKDWKEEMSK